MGPDPQQTPKSKLLEISDPQVLWVRDFLEATNLLGRFVFWGMDIIPMLMRSPVHRFSHIMGVSHSCGWTVRVLTCDRKVFIRLKSIDSRFKCCRSSKKSPWVPKKGISLIDAKSEKIYQTGFFLMIWMELDYPNILLKLSTLWLRSFLIQPPDLPFPQQPGSSAERHPWVKVEAFLGLSLDLESWIHQGTQKIKDWKETTYC